ncbi:MAG: 8-oxo-dGTP diphosphatase [Clostridia bacterium]|nr:8-oxo-dGTP diphosphatase [Clostridia bacterium]
MEKLKTINTTLVLILKDGKILLGEKKRGFAKGTLNGIGGKQDPGETIEEAMIRETQEEIGVTPTAYNLIGKIHFDMWYKGEHANMFLSIYTCTKFNGKIQETEEMLPNWYDVKNIPFDRMLQDDLLWMPLALAEKKFVGEVSFDQNMNMLSHNFKEVENLEIENSK